MANVALRIEKMRIKNNKYFFLLIVLILIYVSACSESNTEIIDNVDEGSVAGVDQALPPEIPAGFVFLENNLGNGLHYIFWEDNIVFLDSEGVNIYQIGINESSANIIIEYEKKIYFNEEKLKELIEIAGIAPETRSKIYSLKDTIVIRGSGDIVYSVKIPYFEIAEKADVSTYTIKRTVTSNDINSQKYKFITSVVTKNGGSYSTYNDWINENTLSVNIFRNEKIGTIILTSPDFPGLTYRIVIDE